MRLIRDANIVGTGGGFKPRDERPTLPKVVLRCTKGQRQGRGGHRKQASHFAGQRRCGLEAIMCYYNKEVRVLCRPGGARRYSKTERSQNPREHCEIFECSCSELRGV